MSDESEHYFDVPADEQRTVRFSPGFHRCHPDPGKNYGIASASMVWVLRVGDWAITWDVHTDWGQPDDVFKAECPDCTHPMHQNGYPTRRPTAGGVQWHAPVPCYEDHDRYSDECSITGAPCYLNTGYLLGDEVFRLLRTEGGEAVWAKLRMLLDEQREESLALAASLPQDEGDQP